MNGQASSTSTFETTPVFITQSTNANQSIDWYGTVRGRAGWIATPNLLLFGTGGFAYGRVDDSASYVMTFAGLAVAPTPVGGFSFTCFPGVTCFTGSSSAIRTGWTAGGGAEWLLDQHWSAKIEYQFVDLGTETIRVTALSVVFQPPGTTPASFNAVFRDQFNVVRLGLNYHF
jgi:outer membrane immunogenic protein